MYSLVPIVTHRPVHLGKVLSLINQLPEHLQNCGVETRQTIQVLAIIETLNFKLVSVRNAIPIDPKDPFTFKLCTILIKYRTPASGFGLILIDRTVTFYDIRSYQTTRTK